MQGGTIFGRRSFLRAPGDDLMKAALLLGYGGVDQLEVREVPEPTTGSGQIKIRVVGASINPIDWKLRQGATRPGMKLELPAILGRDAAGEVVELGPGVTRFRVGTRVTGLVMGGYAERVVAKEEAWAEVPEGLDLVDAAAIPLVSLTGAQLVEEGVRPKAGDTVLVTGAMGSVGRGAVFVAKNLGVRVWAGVRSVQKEAAAAALGVAGVVALDDEADCRRLPALDGIADTVGGATTERVLAKVRRGGAVGTVVGVPPGASERGIEARHVWAHPDPDRLASMVRAVAEGAFVIPIARRFPLSEIREAQEFAEKGAGGKVLLRL
jgi:NADPH:quinone reductase-like Zn-dependent oxidoreductase